MHSNEISGFVFDKDKKLTKETPKESPTVPKTKPDMVQYVNNDPGTSPNQPVNVTGYQEGDSYIIEINEDYENSQKSTVSPSGNHSNTMAPHQNISTALHLDKQEPQISKFAQKVFRNAMLYNAEGPQKVFSNQLYKPNNEMLCGSNSQSNIGTKINDFTLKSDKDLIKKEDWDMSRTQTVSRRKGIFKTPTRLPNTNKVAPMVHQDKLTNNIAANQNTNPIGNVGDFQNGTNESGDLTSVEDRNSSVIENSKENTMKITHVWTLTGNFHSAEIGDGNGLSVQQNENVADNSSSNSTEESAVPAVSEIKGSPAVKWNTQKLAKEIVGGKRMIKPKFPAIVFARRETRSSIKNLRAQSSNKSETQTDNKMEEKTNSGQKKHSCNICGKSYNKIYSLRAHSNLHTGNKLCRCQICGKGFTKKKSLQTHMYLHTGEQPHACDVCGKKFTLQCNLNIHKKLHSGFKPYKCDICHKEFTQLGNMKTHLNTHGNQKPKPFSCSICEKQFMHQSTLNKHVKNHNNTYIL